MASAEMRQTKLRIAALSRDPALERWLRGENAANAIDLFRSHAADAHFAARAAVTDIILMDLAEHALEGVLDALDDLSRIGPPVAVLARGGSVCQAVEAMRHGAADFILRPTRATELVARLGELADAHGTSCDQQPSPPANDDFDEFIGNSEEMRAVYAEIARIAPSAAPAFITGESGTGKELCARAVHRRSGREAGRFIAINCAALPRDLMESELFGHVRGAFTGADENRAGALQLADGGTLFLDEICEMDQALQAKLLRVLQTGMVRRVGDAQESPVDVRFVCATNRDPAAEMAAGRFREDLFFRLHVLPIDLPPLRRRRGDVMALAGAFLKRFSAEENRAFSHFERDARGFLEDYDWPGNVRQLENLIRRIVVMNDGASVSAAMIPLALAHSGSRNPPLPGRAPAIVTPLHTGMPLQAATPTAGIEPFALQERRIIEAALEACGGHVAKAAAALDISPSTIYRKKLGWDNAAALSA